MGAKKVKNPPLVCLFVCLFVCVYVTYEKNKIPYFMQKVYIFIFYTEQCSKIIFFYKKNTEVWWVVCVYVCVAVCAGVSIRSSACF